MAQRTEHTKWSILELRHSKRKIRVRPVSHLDDLYLDEVREVVPRRKARWKSGQRAVKKAINWTTPIVKLADLILRILEDVL